MVTRSGAVFGVVLVFVPTCRSDAGSRQEVEVRDPFSWPTGRAAAPRPPGLAGVEISEITVRGVLLFEEPGGAGRPRGLALLETGEGAGFVAAPGDRLLDGFLERVEVGGGVFRRFGAADREVFAAVGVAPEAAGALGSGR